VGGVTVAPVTLTLTGKGVEGLAVRIDQPAASALRAEGLSTTGVITLLTETSSIKDPPQQGEVLASLWPALCWDSSSLRRD